MSKSPYRLGFTSLESEVSIESLPVQGKLPTWLSGTLLRTGPAKFEVGKQSYNHWFDGLAMLFKFGFSDGYVSYANRFLQSHAYTEAMETGRISRREFATDPCRTLFERVGAFFSSRPADNGNISVNKLGDDVVALTETPLPIRFDADTLETLGVYEHADELRGNVSSAHPHLDFERSRQYTYCIEFGRKSRYRLYGIDMGTGEAESIAEIEVDKPAYMHSFGMTERFLVLAEFPLVVNPLQLRFGGRPFIENYEWEPSRGVTFHVVDKDTGRVVKTAQSAPFYAFHHVNAFEDGDTVIIDVVTYPDPKIIDHLYLERLRSDAPIAAVGNLTRFRLDLGSDTHVLHERVTQSGVELPRIHYERVAGKPYRYVYGVANQIRGGFFDKLVKLDLDERRAISWCEAGCYPGEPVFVAAPGAAAEDEGVAEDEGGAAEDEGVVLSVVLDAGRQSSFLLVLSASSFKELARAEAPHPIPFGLHGNYLGKGRDAFRTLHR